MTDITKEELRAFYKTKRKEISKERRQAAEKALFDTLWPKLSVYRKVMSFCSIHGEIDLSSLNEALASEGRLLLPRIENDQIEAYQVSDLNHLVKGPHGNKEPNPEKDHKVTHLECILVPGIGFDGFHHRLGYGKGHFDRFLKRHPHCPTYGIGFEEQRIKDPLPVESHDIALTHVLFF
jgi:5-formyltetrahydrofolate cyclo-ligase